MKSYLPPVARRLVLYVCGFGVAAGVGMAPFLGKVKVPGFEAMLQLFPWQLQDVLIPLSSFLMGLVAAGVQFYAGEKVAKPRIRLLFRAGLSAMVLGFLLFIVLYFEFVRFPSFGNTRSVAVIVSDTRFPSPDPCGCKPATPDEACIQELSLAPEAIDSCWGGPSLRRRKLLLAMSYLCLMGGFAALIGLLVLQVPGQEKQQRGAPPAGRTRKRPKAGAPRARGGRAP